MSGRATFTPTLGDYASANRSNIRWAWRRPRTLRTWVAFIAIMAAIGAVIGWEDGGVWVPGFALAYALLGFVIMPLVHTLSYLLAPRRLARLYASSLRRPYRRNGLGTRRAYPLLTRKVSPAMPGRSCSDGTKGDSGSSCT